MSYQVSGEEDVGDEDGGILGQVAEGDVGIPGLFQLVLWRGEEERRRRGGGERRVGGGERRGEEERRRGEEGGREEERS